MPLCHGLIHYNLLFWLSSWPQFFQTRGLWCDPTQLHCYKPKVVQGEELEDAGEKKEYIFGAAWTTKNTHHTTRNITDTAPARTIIYISAKLSVLSWDLHFCEPESVSHQEKNHKAVVSGERQFPSCSADMWYHPCLPPLDWRQTQLKGMRAPGTKVSNIHPEAPYRSPSNESSYKRKKFFFT